MSTCLKDLLSKAAPSGLPRTGAARLTLPTLAKGGVEGTGDAESASAGSRVAFFFFFACLSVEAEFFARNFLELVCGVGVVCGVRACCVGACVDPTV